MPSVNRHYSENIVFVAYPVKEQEQKITTAEYHLIRSMDGRKVAAIKFVMEQYSLGLYEAKQIVDTIFNEPGLS